MTTRHTLSALLILAATAALPVSAQTLKPGLWEMNSKMTSDDPQMAQAMEQMQKHMANLPPEQRKQMADAMAKHGGMKLESMGAGGMQVKMCLTKESIQDALLGNYQRGNCKHSKTPMLGNSMSYSFTCTDPVASGEGKVTFNGDTAMTARLTLVHSPAGKKTTMTTDSTGRWLSADCGGIKPIDMKAGAAPKK